MGVTSKDLMVVVSGTAVDEQGFIATLDNLMVQVFGWEIVARITDTSSNRDYWWRSEGETRGEHMTLYANAQGLSNDVNTGIAVFVTEGGAITNEATSNEQAIQWDLQRDWWVVGNKDQVFMFARNSNNIHYLTGFGYLDSPYTSQIDPYPAYVFGQFAATDTFANTRRLRAYYTFPEAIAAGGGVSGGPFLGTVGSGVGTSLVADDLQTLVQLNAPGARDGRYAALKPVFYFEENLSLFAHQIRGEVPQMFQMWGDSTLIGDIITTSGVLLSTGDLGIEDKFIVANEFGLSDNTFIMGPCEEYDLLDGANFHDLSGQSLKLWLQGDVGIERRGGNFFGGRVKAWQDKSSHPSTRDSLWNRNDVTQSTDANQPQPADSTINGKSVVRFDNDVENRYLTGTVEVDTDMTMFAVASYRDGATEGHIFHLRGDVSTADTQFSMSFNTGGSNNATFLAGTADAAAEIDQYRFDNTFSDTFYILTAAVSGTDTEFRLNGSSLDAVEVTNTKGTIASSTTITSAVGTSLADGGGVGTPNLEGDVAEIMVFQSALTVEEIDEIECYLSSRYNITISGTCP